MPVRVRVYDSRIYAMNAPGGAVHRWMNSIKNDTLLFSRIFCPVRTTFLRDSLEGTIGYNQHGVFVNVYAHAPYAKYVHEGTHTPIVPRTANYLRWDGFGRFTGVWRRPWVHGQRPQPFLNRAKAAALRLHGIG